MQQQVEIKPIPFEVMPTGDPVEDQIILPYLADFIKESAIKLDHSIQKNS